MTKQINPPTPSTAYCPSVPISLYREVVGELQATQAQLDFFKSQNQQLVRANQQLRQEAEKILASTENLKQAIAASERTGKTNLSEQNPAVRQSLLPRQAATPLLTQVTIAPGASSQPRPTIAVPPSPHAAKLTALNRRWGLALLIGAIGLTAFAAGFFGIPLLVNQNDR